MTRTIAFFAGPPPKPQHDIPKPVANGADAILDRMKRLETSAPLSRFVFKSFDQSLFWRDGLGPWVGYIVETPDGPFVIASPQADSRLGASIWFAPRLTYKKAARHALSWMSDGTEPAFLTSAGRTVLPQ